MFFVCVFYVFSIDGVLCIVTTVEPLFMLIRSAVLATSARGKWNPFSEMLGKCTKPPMLALPRMFSICSVVIVVDVVFLRGLVEVPLSILLVCIFLLYVFSMMSSMLRMRTMPMTIIAIMAPELCMRICSRDLVVAVRLVTGEAVLACIFTRALFDHTCLWKNVSPQCKPLSPQNSA